MSKFKGGGRRMVPLIVVPDDFHLADSSLVSTRIQNNSVIQLCVHGAYNRVWLSFNLNYLAWV